MTADTGKQLKQSMNAFHTFIEYLFLPKLQKTYILKRNRKYELSMPIRGYPSK